VATTVVTTATADIIGTAAMVFIEDIIIDHGHAKFQTIIQFSNEKISHLDFSFHTWVVSCAPRLNWKHGIKCGRACSLLEHSAARGFAATITRVAAAFGIFVAAIAIVDATGIIQDLIIINDDYPKLEAIIQFRN
jgi:hypothetical protein